MQSNRGCGNNSVDWGAEGSLGYGNCRCRECYRGAADPTRGSTEDVER
jgi:hypothetical protein